MEMGARVRWEVALWQGCVLVALLGDMATAEETQDEAHVRVKRNSRGVSSMVGIMGWAVIQISVCICCFFCFRKLCNRGGSHAGTVITVAQPRPASYPQGGGPPVTPYPQPAPYFAPDGSSALPYPTQPMGPVGWAYAPPNAAATPKFDLPPPSYDEAVALPSQQPPLPLPPTTQTLLTDLTGSAANAVPSAPLPP